MIVNDPFTRRMTQCRRETEWSLMLIELKGSRPIDVSSSFKAKVVP
jgi:hypothetical protein